MFKINYCKFSHIDQSNVKEGKGGSYRTKREALSDFMYNPTMRCEAYITKVY